MAKKIVDIVCKNQRLNKKCITVDIPLSGGDFPFKGSMMKLIEYADNKYDEAKQTGISVEAFKKLFYRYGTSVDLITDKAFSNWNASKDTNEAWIKAEVWYAINYEMILTPNDFFTRRTGLMHTNRKEIEPLLNVVINEMSELLHWSTEEKQQHTDAFIKEYDEAVDFMS